MRRWFPLVVVVLLGLAAGWYAPLGEAPRPGLQLAYIYREDLYVTKPAQKPIRLTRGAGASSPQWSADGRWLTYRAGDQLWLASADGRQIERVTAANPAPVGQADWSPHGPHLAFVSAGGLWVLPVGPEGPSPLWKLHMPAAGFAWAPDGERLAVLEPYGGPWPGERVPDDRQMPQEGVVVVPLQGGGYRDLFRIPWGKDPLGQNRPLYPLTNLAWSPDGRWLTFHRLHWSGSLSADQTWLMVVPSSGGTPRTVGEMLAYPDWVAWAPDASRLGYIAGVGRNAWTGKQLALAAPPSFATQVQTPPGYNDQGLAWAPSCASRKAARLAVVRSGPESPQSPYDRPLPALYLDGKQATRPESPFGDHAPYIDCEGRLHWVRISHRKAMVMTEGEPWVAVDVPGVYYEHWSVGAVVDWWEPGR